ncbi:MAG TPA: FAD-dependent oxidoreductase [Pilimelia sp.]|nr:FAD-dependent oxidoreductase [Pilimelia sp.]
MKHHSTVVVVGGGVIGCAVAYFAARRGLDVTLVDMPKRGRATSASAGGLWPIGESVGLGCGVIFAKAMMAKGVAAADEGHGPGRMPREFLDFALTSNAMFPRLAENLRRDAAMDVELERTSLLFLMYDEGDESYARALWDDYSEQRPFFQWLTPSQVAAAEPALTRKLRGALRFRGDDQLNPYKFADALRAGARTLGATLLPHTEVTGVVRAGSRVVEVETTSHAIACEVMVNAAGCWAGQIAAMAGVDVPVTPVRGQIVCTETLPEILTACVSTTDCYLAQKKHGEVIIGSTTEDVGFDPGTTAAAARSLAAGAVRAVPELAHATVKRTWSGLRPGSPDELPILGPVEGLAGYLNACGHFRTGVLNAPLTGLTIAELAADVRPSYAIEPFLLSRFRVPAKGREHAIL